MKRNKRKRILSTISSILIILWLSIILGFGAFVWFIHLNHNLNYKGSTIDSIEYTPYRPDYITRDYLKEEIEKLFDSPKYVYKDTTLQKPVIGKTTFLIRLIEMDIDISLENYTLAFTHEMVHLTHVTACERYCNFTAFKMLYESGNDYFKNVALAYADNDFRGYVEYNYSCSGYIEEYLQEKGII